jgi:riboflavin kinase/FMN adenylyltransferase
MKRLYEIMGIVQKGHQRGRNLGFPTANVALKQKIPSGIYISYTTIDNNSFTSVTFIGEAKTFDEAIYQAETYILDFQQDIYGKEITVTLLQKIRENKKFLSADNLIDQMKKDEVVARDFFKKHPDISVM